MAKGPTAVDDSVHTAYFTPVTVNVLSNDVSVIDTRSLGVVATIPVGRAPYGAALAHGNRLLYITNQHADTVSVIDAETLTVRRTLDGFGYPEGVAAHGDRVYVVNWMDDNVAVLDAASGRTLATIATADGDCLDQLPHGLLRQSLRHQAAER